jgi:hypothetical protein
MLSDAAMKRDPALLLARRLVTAIAPLRGVAAIGSSRPGAVITTGGSEIVSGVRMQDVSAAVVEVIIDLAVVDRTRSLLDVADEMRAVAAGIGIERLDVRFVDAVVAPRAATPSSP